MKIVITMYKLRDLREYMNELHDRYQNIISKYNRLENTMKFTNGDIIKGYSAASRRDGVMADVAIGIDAESLACGSKEEYPVWNIEKLQKYLDSIECKSPRSK